MTKAKNFDVGDVAVQAFKMGVSVAFYTMDSLGTCGPYACLSPSVWPEDDSQIGRMAEVFLLATYFPGKSEWDAQPPLRTREPWTLTLVWRGQNKSEASLWLADLKRAIDSLGSGIAELDPPCTESCFACLNKPELGFRNPGTMRMILCRKCGCKRCPHATDHRHACTRSNEPGQPGSSS